MAEDYKPVTAQDRIAPHLRRAETDEQKKAREAGLVSAAYLDYEKALKNYESRSDIETLEARRAREAGRSFDDGKVVREHALESAWVEGEDAVKAAESRKEAEAWAREQHNVTTAVSEGREEEVVDHSDSE